MTGKAAQTDKSGEERANRPPMAPKAEDKAEMQTMLALIRALLAEGKAENIVVLDIAARSALADYMVIAGGTSARHLAALADRLLTMLKGQSGATIRVEGLGSGAWVLLDAGDIIIHLFQPEARALYRLETMWAADKGAPGEAGPEA